MARHRGPCRRRLITSIPVGEPPTSDDRLRVAMGLDAEIVKQLIRPMATEGHEAIWSMGDDTPIAPLARRPRRVSAFLRQSFAQVTNPPIDPERERAVMSLAMAIGRQPDLLGDARAAAVVIDSPILDHDGWGQLLGSVNRVAVVDATWPISRGPRGLAFGMARLARQARSAARRGVELVVVSDRAAGPRRVAIPSILAAGRVNQELVAAGRRSRTDLAVEAGDAFDVHDLAMLIAVGASAVHPWLLLELAAEQAGERGSEELAPDQARRNTVDALEQGLRKVLARMGISALSLLPRRADHRRHRHGRLAGGPMLPGRQSLAGIGHRGSDRPDSGRPPSARLRGSGARPGGSGIRPVPRRRGDPRLRAEDR